MKHSLISLITQNWSLECLTGERQSNINIADGKKSSVILASEAAKMDQVNRAQGLSLFILFWLPHWNFMNHWGFRFSDRWRFAFEKKMVHRWSKRLHITHVWMEFDSCNWSAFYSFDISCNVHITGEAEAILARAQATAKGLAMVSQALKESGGVEVSQFLMRIFLLTDARLLLYQITIQKKWLWAMPHACENWCSNTRHGQWFLSGLRTNPIPWS